MKYLVRMPDNPEGVLEYGSMREVEQAYLSGLIGPDDEIKEANATKWRKASSLPVLAKARRTGNQVWGGTQFLWMMVTVVIGSLAFFLIQKGVKNNAHGYTGTGLLLAIALAALLMRVTANAFKRSKPG